MILVVQNIEHRVNENDLQLLFNSYGEVVDTNLFYDITTWESKGYAIVEMGSKKEATEAMVKLNGSKFHGKSLVISKAQVIENKD